MDKNVSTVIFLVDFLMKNKTRLEDIRSIADAAPASKKLSIEEKKRIDSHFFGKSGTVLIRNYDVKPNQRIVMGTDSCLVTNKGIFTCDIKRIM